MELTKLNFNDYFKFYHSLKTREKVAQLVRVTGNQLIKSATDNIINQCISLYRVANYTVHGRKRENYYLDDDYSFDYSDYNEFFTSVINDAVSIATARNTLICDYILDRVDVEEFETVDKIINESCESESLTIIHNSDVIACDNVIAVADNIVATRCDVLPVDKVIVSTGHDLIISADDIELTRTRRVSRNFKIDGSFSVYDETDLSNVRVFNISE
jgi:hypothetical protein